MQKRVFLKANLRKKTRRHETHISPNDINDTHDCMLVQYMHSSQFLPAVRSSQLSVTPPGARGPRRDSRAERPAHPTCLTTGVGGHSGPAVITFSKHFRDSN